MQGGFPFDASDAAVRAVPPPSWVLYVDMDAFYVNCELRRRPDLRGEPILVGHAPTGSPTRSVVLSASYEAREFGVHSAQPVAEAARRCPQARWIAPDFELYERTSREVRAWLEARFPSVSPQSIDEAAVSAEAPTVEAAGQIATMAQASLRSELDLPSSWGVATSRLVAKIASDRAKPGGVIAVPPDRIASFLEPLPVRAIPGVGPKTADILGRAGIETVGDLARRRSSELRKLLGPWGHDLVAIARGHPPPDPDEPGGPRSRSSDRTFNEDLRDASTVEREVAQLAQELGEAVQREGVTYGGVGVAIRWADFDRVQRSRALPGTTSGPASLVVNARRLVRELLVEEAHGRSRAVRTITVRAERLAPRTASQVSLDRYDPG